jgi:hypothetical protein
MIPRALANQGLSMTSIPSNASKLLRRLHVSNKACLPAKLFSSASLPTFFTVRSSSPSLSPQPPSSILLRPSQRAFHNSTVKMADGAMNGGNFTHGNTTAPTTDHVLPLFSLKGRTAIVSGAGAGIGLAVAHALAEAGANVAIWYNSNKKALKEAEKIEAEYGVKCEFSSSCCELLDAAAWLERMY